MILDKPLEMWIKTEQNFHHEFYRTAEWAYMRVENDRGDQRLWRYHQSSNLTETFYEDEMVDTLPDHAIPMGRHDSKASMCTRTHINQRVAAADWDI